MQSLLAVPVMVLFLLINSLGKCMFCLFLFKASFKEPKYFFSINFFKSEKYHNNTVLFVALFVVFFFQRFVLKFLFISNILAHRLWLSIPYIMCFCASLLVKARLSALSDEIFFLLLLNFFLFHFSISQNCCCNCYQGLHLEIYLAYHIHQIEKMHI